MLLARLEFGIPDYEDETIMPYLKTRNDRYSKVPANILAEYGVMDVVVTLRLKKLLEQRLKDEGLYEWPFMRVLMPAANAFVRIELRGLAVDREQLETIEQDFKVQLDKLIAEAREMTGRPALNLNSFQQVGVVIYDDLKLPQVRGRKIKPRSTNAAVLDKLKGKHPFIALMKTYRRVNKMRSSYAVNLLKQIGTDGRVHANFLIPGTEVSRLAVRNPALQTIPRPDDYYGALIRSAFVPKPGYVLVHVDYSQAELRVLACVSEEPFLIKVYQDGRDLHTEVAVAMHGEGFTKAQRVQCKMFNFSYAYGGTEYSFAQDAGLDLAIARRFVKDYNRQMPRALQYKRDQLKTLRKQGYVETIFGRRRRFPLIVNHNFDDARKACVHMPIASTASDLTLMCTTQLELDHNIPVVLTVHDSIIAEVLVEDAEYAAEVMTDVMVNMGDKYLPQVPWVVDPEIKERWADPLPHP